MTPIPFANSTLVKTVAHDHFQARQGPTATPNPQVDAASQISPK